MFSGLPVGSSVAVAVGAGEHRNVHRRHAAVEFSPAAFRASTSHERMQEIARSMHCEVQRQVQEHAASHRKLERHITPKRDL